MTIEYFKRAAEGEYLSKDQIIQAAPAVYAEEPWPEVSSKYQFVNTSHVIEKLATVGFYPTAVGQLRTKNDNWRNYLRHEVRLAAHGRKELKVGDSAFELILGSAHDATTAFSTAFGLYRLICSNGMVVSDQEFGKERIIHMHDAEQQVLDVLDDLILKIPQINERYDEYQKIKISRRKQLSFAKKAAQLRWGKGIELPIEMKSLLEVRREQDAGDQLWKVFNRVQENLLRGGMKTIPRVVAEKDVRITTIQPLHSIDVRKAVNEGLWEVMETFAKAA